MRGRHPPLEGSSIEGAWFPARLAFNQHRANGLSFGATFLLAPDEVADAFAVVGVVPSANLRLNPTVLLVGQSDGLAHGAHDVPSKTGVDRVNISYHRRGIVQNHTRRQPRRSENTVSMWTNSCEQA